MRTHLFRLLLALVCLVATLPTLPAAAQAATVTFPQTGFSVADSAQGRFLGEFRRLGGVDSLGYPISQPFVAEGFTYQAFQRAVLQWRPEANQSYLANTLDWLSDAGNDAYLGSLGIPGPLRDAGGSWEQVVAERESWLTSAQIAAAYRQGGGYPRFGLPTSRPQQAGPFVVQRFQRYVFQLWTESVPGMPARGSVVGVLVGDLLKETNLIPEQSTVAPPAGADGVTCVSNPESAVKSRDVDIVGYRFVALEGGNQGLAVTVRNNCDEPREIGLRARAANAPGAPPVAVGRQVIAQFDAGEERSFNYSFANLDGSYPEVNANQALTFRWNWQRVGSNEEHCLAVGAGRCLPTDPWLQSAVEDLSNLPVGAALLRSAAEFGVSLRRGDLPADTLGVYQQRTRVITIARRLDPYPEFERGTVIAHELRHAVDHAERNLGDSSEACVAAEERAFRQGAEVWASFWQGSLPRPTNPMQRQLNLITVTAQTNPDQLDEAILRLYEDACE